MYINIVLPFYNQSVAKSYLPTPQNCYNQSNIHEWTR